MISIITDNLKNLIGTRASNLKFSGLNFSLNISKNPITNNKFLFSFVLVGLCFDRNIYSLKSLAIKGMYFVDVVGKL